jgi:resolvase-like protein
VPTSLPNLWERPEAGRVGAGDGLMIGKLDRLGRSLRQVIAVVTPLVPRGVDYQSLPAPLDTTTRSGHLLFPMFGALAEFARDLSRERAQTGRTAAWKWDCGDGHQPGLFSQAEATALTAATAYRAGQLSGWQCADKLHRAQSPCKGPRAGGHAA